MNKEGIILGISEESDAGVAIVKKGKILYAINEERLVRKKSYNSFPYRSLSIVLEYLKTNKLYNELRAIAIASEIHVNKYEVSERPVLAQKILGFLSYCKFVHLLAGNCKGIKITRFIYIKFQFKRRNRLKKILKQYNLDFLPVHFYDHHFCHAVSAYMTSPFLNCLTITLDAAGDGYCSKVYRCENGRMLLLHRIPFFHSIGYYYTLVTFILGFKTGQQGKVTGLSASGNADNAMWIFKRKIKYNSKRMIFKNYGKYYFYEMPGLKMLLNGFKREDIAAAIQKHLEISVVEYIRDIIRKYNFTDIDLALAGGVFANVILNRKISQIENIKRLYIHPNMGDGGLSAGAALALYKELNQEVKPSEIKDVYFGCDFSNNEIKKNMDICGLGYEYYEDIEKEVAKLLAMGKVIARFNGRMEYGPRALGHRSILCQPTDAAVNDWLNKKLNRSEFMPFAPAILEEFADEYFIFENQYHPAYFMTIVCDTTLKCKKECPGIVHIDGTARPQIVNKDISPSFYKIIKEYHMLTGIPLVINTSFNMHEEPIVCSPMHAIDCFLRGSLDYLAIGNFLVVRAG